MTISPLSPTTDPATWTMSVTEDLVLPFDVTGDLVQFQTPTSPTAILYDIEKDVVVTLAHAPVVTGPDANSHYFIDQRVSGPAGDLPHPGNYRLTITFTAFPSTNVWAMELTVIAIP